jgi:multidrug transporter EmrE-like cation transporter
MMYVMLALFFQSAALVASKYASTRNVGINRYLCPEYLSALIFLVLQALVWQQALKKKPLNVVYPYMSIIYVIIPIISFFFFGEPITINQVIGSSVIITGIIVMYAGPSL